MAKVFEDYFTDLQSDMISVCMEYVNNKADEVYIHCSCEADVNTCNVFFRINGTVIKRSKINDVLSAEQKKQFQYDVSDERQIGLVHAINEDMEKIAKLCGENNRPVPTEIKIIYNVAKNSMKADYGYEMLYSNKANMRVSDIFNAWFEKVKQ